MATSEYRVTMRWVGNDGRGTAELETFGRDGELSSDGLPTIPTSSSPDHAGSAGGWTPEDLLAGAVSQCQMLWFLHLCAKNEIVVQSYVDDVVATLKVKGSKGTVSSIALNVSVEVSSGDLTLAESLFTKAGELCYVARSLSSPVTHTLSITSVPVPG
ncbi:MAG TPA: OsmC family protein [Microthrixaceae bacterium]|nr:OsmC family protein [Microthrixaceae bacterium]